ncbi:vWA domain-containing protein, partial [Accumulibacter sp.]|uniref:vWA domain-containing protein n=1 Tax=Accumulibacter sp. TaxID=2053492 RepID=UPI0025E597BB
IPLTVGDIYGRSGLPDSDALIHGGPSGQANLTVRCRDGQVRLSGGRLEDGYARVPLDAPIDLVVTCPTRETLRGRAADGREVALTIRPYVGGDGALDVAFLIDHSGSMNEVCSGASRGVTKHQAIILGLRSLARRLRDEDAFDLWEFDNQLAHVGSTSDTQRRGLFGLGGKLSAGERLLRLLDRLKDPAGGTEIGAALSGTIRGSNARDILLVTDGKSHALDVQALARMGRRVHVVLVGEDSLEANVGHLAALTGGDILVAAGADLGDFLLAAVDSLRAPFEAPPRIEGRIQHLRVVRGNAVIEADWRPARGGDSEDPYARAVAAFAASLALPCLDEEAAAALAEAEGLVTHLTSLVLVDEAAEAHEGLPATHKIALPTPRTADFLMEQRLSCAPSMLGEHRAEADETPVVAAYSAPGVCRNDLSQVLARIDWDAAPDRLRRGDLSSLDREVARMIEQAAALPEVIATAHRLGITPTQLVLALLARTCAGANRAAARLARAILGARIFPEIEDLYAQLGLAGMRGTTQGPY